MKAQCLILTNSREMEKAEDMNLNCNPIYAKRDFLFDINDVNWAGITIDRNIEMSVNMTVVTVEYEVDLWNKLKLRFNA